MCCGHLCLVLLNPAPPWLCPACGASSCCCCPPTPCSCSSEEPPPAARRSQSRSPVNSSRISGKAPHLFTLETRRRRADLSHELLGGEDQLVVDEPAGLLLKQRAVGVGVDRLLVLHRLVAAFAKPGCVVEVSGCHCLRGAQTHTLMRQTILFFNELSRHLPGFLLFYN